MKAATSLHDVAHLLGFKPKALAYLLYVLKDKYTQFEIAKRSGGKRRISAPHPELKNLQRRLSDYLQDCIADINKAGRIESALSHGFRRKHSIVTNAYPHRNRRFVFNVDLEGFFPSINFGRVRGFFLRNRHFELHPKVATVLAQIACHDNQLPQGSPCSPVISNLIGHLLDIRLAALAYSTGCTYSRYADDLTFSTNKPVFPRDIAQTAPGTVHGWIVGEKLERAIRKVGFSVNPAKTRLQYTTSRQEVTGLVVNAKINARSEYRRTARAMVDRLCKTGKFQVRQFVHDSAGNQVSTLVDGTSDQLNGILSFIDMVRRGKKKADDKTHQAHDSYANVYRRFLLFKDFYASTTPTIVCEGKTDNIYIRAALRRLVKAFPQLAAKNPNGSVTLKVRIHRYSRVVRRILHLSGGTGDLTHLLPLYMKECKQFSPSEMGEPLIVLIDNDDGAKGLLAQAAQLGGRPLGRKGDFYFIRHNVYLVLTPELGGKSTTIEDFFPKTLKAKKLKGKKFNPGKKGFDKKTEYGKVAFAEHVVKKNESRINFSGFKPILERIQAVLDDHKKRNKTLPI